MWAALCLLLAAPFAGDTVELISNGGFERLRGAGPEAWDLFVAPLDESIASDGRPAPSARVARDASAGEYCVELSTPLPYPREPYNNWSQNLFGAFAGKRLKLSAALRTDNADGAAIWVQCWKRQPLHVLHVANTALQTPMTGTHPWTRHEIEFDVPAGTDFLTVRCVLKGAGTAWFDELSLTESPPLPAPEPAASVEAKPEEPTQPSPEEDKNQQEQPSKIDKPTIESAIPTEASAIEAELARLKEANVLLAEALDSMQSDRAQLVQDLLALQTQMQALQEALPAALARENSSPPPLPPGSKSPPLVPLDFPESAP
ncbi:MAG: hypothetical protein RLZZ303_1278 [Candidatus Hydrogenedentota bacterium]